MATPHRTKQISLRFPLPLLSQVKSLADAKQQAIADWILATISRELEVKAESNVQANHQIQDDQSKSETQSPPQSELVSYIDDYVQSYVQKYVQSYLKKCLEPIYLQVSEISELRLQLGEFKA
jgi:hypothetical protein